MRTQKECTCPHGERPLGKLHGISLGRGIVRLATEKGCPEHDSCHGWTKRRVAEYKKARPWSTVGPWCPIHRNKGCPE